MFKQLDKLLKENMASSSFVSVNIIGFLSNPPTLFLKNGSRWLRFVVIVSQNSNGQNDPIEFQVYFPYRETLNFFTNVKPGSKVHISGNLYVSKWKTISNMEKTSFVVRAKIVNLLK